MNRHAHLRTRKSWRPAIGALAAMLALVTVPAAAAPSRRVTAVPAGNVFDVRVVGDTITTGVDTLTFVSTDGGATWHGSVPPAPNRSLVVSVWFRNHRLYAGTFGEGVFVSDDLGSTWQAFNQGLVGGFLDTQLSLEDLQVRGDSLYAATAGAGVYVRNLTAADTWHPFGAELEPNQASNVNDLELGGTRLVASAGANGTIFHHDPSEPDWTISFLDNVGLRPATSAQSALFTGSGWIVGTNNGVFFSAGGEAPWTASDTRLRNLAWSTFARMGNVVFAAFDSVNHILIDESRDGGASWTRKETVFPGLAYRLAVHGEDLYAGRADGLWIQSGATTSVAASPASGRLQFTLAGPQPMRDVARFRFELARAGSIALEFFDVAGRRVADRIEARPAGPQEMTVGVRTLPPGVYAARLTSGPVRESVRMVRVP